MSERIINTESAAVSANWMTMESPDGMVCDLATGMCGTAAPARPSVKVTYVTDPICSACWAMEPAWRAVGFHFGHVIGAEHLYGGLLPGWDGFADPSNGIGHYSDVARHWADMAEHTGQAMNTSVWDTDPISSSFPPSELMTAVRDIDPANEELMLRRLREQLFVHGRNISRPEVWASALAAAGIDRHQVRRRMGNGRARTIFAADLDRARALRVSAFPSLILGRGEDRVVLRGVQDFDRLAAVIAGMAQVPFRRRAVTVEEAIDHLDVGTTAEYATVLGLPPSEVERALTVAGLHATTLPGGKVWSR